MTLGRFYATLVPWNVKHLLPTIDETLQVTDRTVSTFHQNEINFESVF